MKRANVLGAALVAIGMAGGAVSASAQVTVGADGSLYSSYVWRGLSLTNKPVLQPDVYVTFPAGKASVTLGGWANFDLGKYDDVDDDISESGGLSSFNFAEFDPWAEVSFPVGEKTTLTGGITAYIYPNDVDVAPNGGLGSDANTVELYAKAAFDVPLSPKLSLYYDVDKIKGAYFEGGISHTVPASEKVGIALGATVGFNAGQGVPDDPNSDESANFADNGFTHLDLSAGIPLTAGVLSITPALHLVINGDDFTKFTSPTDEKDAKLWGGVTVNWSKDYGGSAEEATEETPE
jgi:hypothetical protein